METPKTCGCGDVFSSSNTVRSRLMGLPLPETKCNRILVVTFTRRGSISTCITFQQQPPQPPQPVLFTVTSPPFWIFSFQPLSLHLHTQNVTQVTTELSTGHTLQTDPLDLNLPMPRFPRETRSYWGILSRTMMVNGGDQRPPNNKESWEFKGNATFTPRRRRPYEGRNPTILPSIRL